MISRFGLDCRPYNKRDNKTWERSDIREWLNSSFIEDAFSLDDQKILVGYRGTVGGVDRVSLLTKEQAETLLTDSEAICSPTAYAESRGAAIPHGWWWLQTSKTTDAKYAMTVLCGKIAGADKTAKMIAVRPVIWIDNSIKNS